LLYLSSWRDLQRWSQATAFWLFDKPEITPLPIPTNVETAPWPSQPPRFFKSFVLNDELTEIGWEDRVCGNSRLLLVLRHF
jgi:hypothetical protein